MVLMMGHIVADVAMKYALNDPIDGTTEVVAAYYMTAIVFLPIAYVALSREQALQTYTVNGAYASFEEDLKGSISPNKLADFVILAEDPHQVDPDKIKEIKV